jgi:hypothetical protein
MERKMADLEHDLIVNICAHQKPSGLGQICIAGAAQLAQTKTQVPSHP